MKIIIVTTLLLLATISPSFSQNELKNYLVIKSKTGKAWTVIPEGKRIKVLMTNKELHKGTFHLDLNQETGELAGIIIKGDTLLTSEITYISYNSRQDASITLIALGAIYSSIGLLGLLFSNKSDSHLEIIPADAIAYSTLGLGIVPLAIGGLISRPKKYPQNNWEYSSLQTALKKNSKEFSKKIDSK